MWQLYYELEGTVERVAVGATRGVEDAAQQVVAVGERGVTFVRRQYGRAKAHFDCVYTACEDARSQARTELVRRFQDIELGQVVDGLLDGFEQMLVTILGCTTGGAVVGGALGAFAAGVGAVPGATIGAGLGLEAGVFALKVMGLAAIVEYVVHALPEALNLYKKGLREAWDAPQDPLSGVDRPDHARMLHVRAATRLIADAHVRMIVIILMGIVACLLAKLDTAELAESMEGGSLGENFPRWLTRYGEQLKARPDLQPRANRILQPADEAQPLARPANLSTNKLISEETNQAKGAAGTPKNYGVAFFGKDNYTKYYSDSKVLIGAPGGKPFFFMPAEDSGLVTNAGDAARYTGMAPSAQSAYMTNGDIYGISFPTDGMPVKPPTAEDAGGWPHFLEGGNTAVKLEGPNAGYLLNPTREFVVPGGSAAPPGSVIFQLGPHGEWLPLRKF